MVIVVVVNLKGVFKNRELAVLICASKVQPLLEMIGVIRNILTMFLVGPVFLG